jgi:hypothetical protein
MLATAILIYIYSPGADFLLDNGTLGHSRPTSSDFLSFRTTVVNDDFLSAGLIPFDVQVQCG